VFLPSNDYTPEELAQIIKSYDDAIATVTEGQQIATGLEKKQIEARIEDMVQGRANAIKIAQLTADTSRYGTDVGRQTRLDELTQNQRQFDSTHALDLQKFGLDYAKAYTDYARTPDMRWSANDFDTAVANIRGGGGPVSARAQAAPTPKSWESFAALQGFNTPVVRAGAGGGQAYGGGGGAGASAGGAGAGAPDLRLKAMQAVGAAMPPSDGTGHDSQDWAALDALKSLYFSGRPGEVEKLGAPRRKIAQAGLARLGYDPALVESDRQRGLPGQQSVRRA